MLSNTRAAIFALIAYGIFSTHDVIVKFVSETQSAFQIVFFSSLLSFPLLTLMMVGDKTIGNLRPKYPGWTVLRSLIIPFIPASAFYAFSVLPLAQAYALLFATPLLITLLSIPVLKERVGVQRLAAVGVGFIGVLVVLRPGGTELGLGHAAALLAALGNATQSVILRKVSNEERAIVLMLYPMLGTVALMGLTLPFVYVPLEAAELGGLAVVALFGFCATLLVVKAYTIGEAATVAPMQYSQIIWATLYGSLLFGEDVDAMTLTGAAIIIASGIFIVLREARGGRSDNTPVLNTRSRAVTSGGANVSLMVRLRQRQKTD
ncbi:EamA family transporter [Epibacterium sp. SM1979]|uniref:EamA family transporter n=1 Tax=Tritonibacter litoralis TaxID=2662264 RepID=A0A843YKR4_9RHOB|nr:DMT family transporter [Tritonibacter litoralis]MQQ10408.1 EamA family transporter [Tritonibacter litoralis]